MPVEVQENGVEVPVESSVSHDRTQYLCLGQPDPVATCKAYSKLSDVYENDMNTLSYSGPRTCATLLDKYLKDQKDCRIIDVAAGTGMIAKELKVLGYTNIDAVDGSAEMLELAKKLNLYKKFVCSFVTDQPTPGLESKAYDALVTSGSFIEGHLKPNVCQEFIRLIKKGGYVIVAMRAEFLEIIPELTKLEPTMAEYERKGQWRRVEGRKFDKYLVHRDGMLFVYQVLV